MFAPDCHELIKANELKSYVPNLELALLAMLERRESRSNHIREDYPFQDDVNWLKWVVLKQGGRGIEVRSLPLPLHHYPVRPVKYERRLLEVPLPERS